MPDFEYDLEAFDAKWEAEQAETVVEEDVLDAFEDVEDTEHMEEIVDDGQDAQEEETIPEVEPPINDPDAEKRNATFAQMRRERDEALKQAAFLQKLADDNGMSVEDVVQRYENARLEEQSEAQGVPIEVLQQLQSQKQELENLKYQSFSARFNAEVESTIEKYKVNEQDLEATFAYAQQNGLTDSLKAGTTSFEAVHKMAHMDAMIEAQVQNALQNSLTQKKKRQQEATVVNNSGGVASEPSLEDQAIADAKEIMANGGF